MIVLRKPGTCGDELEITNRVDRKKAQQLLTCADFPGYLRLMGLGATAAGLGAVIGGIGVVFLC
jgi:hypothetical protein